MQIIHVLNHTRQSNGHVHQAMDLACQQRADGHVVWMASGGGDFESLLAEHGVNEIRLPFERSVSGVVRSLGAIARHLSRLRPHVVHAHMMQAALLAAPPCRFRGIPLVTTVHNAFDRHARLMAVGTRVIAVSEAVRLEMQERGIGAGKLATVLNGTVGTPRDSDLAGVPRLEGSPSFLFAGGLHPRKGLPVLLAAFDAVHRTYPAARLHIIGDGPFAKAYAEQAAQSPSGASIAFHGTQRQPMAWMRAADVFVLPSLEEPAALVLSEARAAGCAVVGSQTGGIPEMLGRGRAGLLVPAGDADALAEVLRRLAGDPAVLAQWRANAGIGLDHLSLARVARETLAVYRAAGAKA